jgi:hypothetical protein
MDSVSKEGEDEFGARFGAERERFKTRWDKWRESNSIEHVSTVGDAFCGVVPSTSCRWIFVLRFERKRSIASDSNGQFGALQTQSAVQ